MKLKDLRYARMRVAIEYDWVGQEWVADMLDYPGCCGTGNSPWAALKQGTAFIQDWERAFMERKERREGND